MLVCRQRFFLKKIQESLIVSYLSQDVNVYCTAILFAYASFNHETEPTVSFSIQAKDKDGLVAVVNLTMEVLDVNDEASVSFKYTCNVFCLYGTVKLAVTVTLNYWSLTVIACSKLS